MTWPWKRTSSGSATRPPQTTSFERQAWSLDSLCKALPGAPILFVPLSLNRNEGRHEVRDGLPLAALDRLIADGVLTEREVETHFIPRRTLYARRRKGSLSREQSDLVVRLARIQAMADDVLGSRAEAHAWLREANGALGGQTPLLLLDTEEGGRAVEAVLGRIAHGVVE